jgi:hypothetical protein
MDKNKFWLGGRLSNTASRHVRNARHVRKQGGPTHVRNANARHVCNATQGTSQRKSPIWAAQRTSASWAAQRTSATQTGGPTHVRNANARQGNVKRKRKARHVRNAQGTSNARHVRNANARHVHNARHVRTSASWAPQRNARHVRKMVAQTQNSSATKASTQGSTRLKDEPEDG